MTILSNTLHPEIGGSPNHLEPSDGCYYIEAIGGHLDIIWTVDDLIEAYKSGETLCTVLTDKVIAQLPEYVGNCLDLNAVDLDFQAVPDRLNALRITLDLTRTAGSFNQCVALELGYKPAKWELTAYTRAGLVAYYEEVA